MATAWARLQALGGPSHHPHYAALSPGGGPAPEVACMRGLRAAVELMAGEAAAAAAFRGGGAGAHAAALAARSMVQVRARSECCDAARCRRAAHTRAPLRRFGACVCGGGCRHRCRPLVVGAQGVCVAHAARRLLRLEALLGPAALATPSHAYWQVRPLPPGPRSAAPPPRSDGLHAARKHKGQPAAQTGRTAHVVPALLSRPCNALAARRPPL